MKKFIIVSVLLCSLFLAPVFASAQAASNQSSLTQQLIQLLTQLISQLEQEINAILAQRAVTTTTPAPLAPHVTAVTPFVDPNGYTQYNVTGTGFLGSNPFVDGQSATYGASSLTDTSVTLLSVKQLSNPGTHNVYLANPADN